MVGSGRVRIPVAGAVLLGWSACWTTALGQVTVRDPGTYVVDEASLIDEQRERQLNSLLADLERKTTAQVKVLTVATTEGEDFFEFVQRHAELWKLGRAGKDNGALIVLAFQERKVRVQTGYGLEGALPDSWCGSLTRQIANRHFQADRYSQGLFDLTAAVANKVADEANVTLAGAPKVRHRVETVGPVNPRGAVFAGIPLAVFVLILIALSRRRRHYRRWGGGLAEGLFWGSVVSNLMRGGRSSWGGGGGFGGGGFGSFGGGGRFGGGGGGASW